MKYLIFSVLTAAILTTTAIGAGTLMTRAADFGENDDGTIYIPDEAGYVKRPIEYEYDESDEGTIIIPEESISDEEFVESFNTESPEDTPIVVDAGTNIETAGGMIADEILYKAVQAEAGNQDKMGKEMVASVILNRVNSPDFPNTIRDVVYEPRQFEVVSIGLIDRVKPDASTIEAVNTVLNSGIVTPATYFRKGNTGWHRHNLTMLCTYGAHTFYK